MIKMDCVESALENIFIQCCQFVFMDVKDMKRFMHELIDCIWINYVRVPKGNLGKVAIWSF